MDASIRAVDEAPAWPPGEEWRLSETPVLTIGAVDGPDVIGTIGDLGAGGVALLGDGRIAIADGQADEIRIYDASGARLAAAGRPGDGPGEFRGLSGVASFAGDSLLAWDHRGGLLGSAAVFGGDGAFARTVPVSDRELRNIHGVSSVGALLAAPREWTAPGWEEPALGEYREPRVYERVSPSGQALGTFGPVPGPERVALTASQRALVYFGRDTHVTMGRRFIYSGDSGSFDIGVHEPETGAIVRHLRRPYEPAPVSAEEMADRVGRMVRGDSLLDAINARFGQDLVERARARRPDPRQVPARETHPAFDGIVEDADENVWVRHARRGTDSLQTWSVFDAEGSWLGEVHMPAEFSVRAIGSDAVAVVVRDALEVEYVHIYRLVK